MCGRAGRKGKDDAGETYLICIKADLEAVCDLLDADMPAIESCLAPEKRGLKRYVLASLTPTFSYLHILGPFLKLLPQGWYLEARQSKTMCVAHFSTSLSTESSCIPL